MKKTVSILFAVIILLTGMHLTIATHFCGGVKSSTKISLTGKLASCGMGTVKSECPANGMFVPKSCCEDELSVYAVDNNYTASSFELKNIPSQLLHVLLVPVTFAFQSLYHSNYSLTDVSPPDKILASIVVLADICVFRK